MKAEALNDPEKYEKTMYKSPETYVLHYIMTMDNTFTKTFVNVKF